ncbi:MAG TPA: AAA family ATPase, partial [Rhodopila sp.]
MAKPSSRFVCQACGAVTPKWAGRCETCGEWNTVEEEAILARPGSTIKQPANRGVMFVGLAGSAEPPPRASLGIAELDRVLGGGLVPASAVLVGGDPGIGKSTLLLQAAARLARNGRRVLYVSGEESIDQVRLRGRRLGVADSPIELAAAINVREIAASLEQAEDTALVVIDSIQTMWLDAIDSAPGTVAQVRACSFELIRLAKSGKFALVLVGHVTKDGALAGPRVLEHMVDAVLYFEGDRGHQFRILRAVKNRFGA